MAIDILLFTADYPPAVGGVANYYSGLAHAWGEGFAVVTSVIGERAAGVRRISWSWPVWPRWLPLLWQIPKYKLLTHCRFLAAGELLPIGTALFLIRMAFGWPYMVFLHGLDVQVTQNSRWRRWLTRQVLGQADWVVVNSNFTKQLATHAGARSTAVVIVYPCPTIVKATKIVMEELRQRYQLTGKLVVLSVARLVPRKNIGMLINAVVEAHKSVPNLQYVVVGDGVERVGLEERATQAGLPVIFTGQVSAEERAAWYELCDVFALTPKSDAIDVEGFGTVFLEAQAAGKPVLGTNVGGVPEAVGEVGVLVTTPVELTSALVKLLSTAELRRQLGEFGRARVMREFTWEVQCQRLRQALRLV